MYVVGIRKVHVADRLKKTNQSILSKEQKVVPSLLKFKLRTSVML
jgi:hypothetical protein